MLQKEYLDEKEASFYMMQILQAIDYFHKQKIVHLDLKVQYSSQRIDYYVMGIYSNILKLSSIS